MQINPEPVLASVGGKAYQLYRLKEICAVPPFFVLQFDDPSEISQPHVQAQIIQACNYNGFDRMAVRSSATCEDSMDASFAGMFETVLNVSPLGVIDAVTAVLKSVYSKRVEYYCASKDILLEKIRMPVLVQRMIGARISGVCFSRLPNAAEQILIEACYGLGEGIVSGRFTPDRCILSRATLDLTDYTAAYQDTMLLVDDQKEFGTREAPVPFHRRYARKLTIRELKTIAETSIEIEAKLGMCSVDVEWAFDGDKLLILQGRPICSPFGNDQVISERQNAFEPRSE